MTKIEGSLPSCHLCCVYIKCTVYTKYEIIILMNRFFKINAAYLLSSIDFIPLNFCELVLSPLLRIVMMLLPFFGAKSMFTLQVLLQVKPSQCSSKNLLEELSDALRIWPKDNINEMISDYVSVCC